MSKVSQYSSLLSLSLFLSYKTYDMPKSFLMVEQKNSALMGMDGEQQNNLGTKKAQSLENIIFLVVAVTEKSSLKFHMNATRFSYKKKLSTYD